MPLGGYVEPG